MRERLNLRNVALLVAVTAGAVACSTGRGDTIEACGDEWDNEPSGIIVGPDGVLRGYNNFTFDELIEITNDADYGEDYYSKNWFMGDPVDKHGELACFYNDILLLTSDGEDALESYIEQQAGERDCDRLQDNPSYSDLDIDC